MILIVVTDRLLSTTSYLGRTLPAVVQYGAHADTSYPLVSGPPAWENTGTDRGEVGAPPRPLISTTTSTREVRA